jgi:hypothetical protein
MKRRSGGGEAVCVCVLGVEVGVLTRYIYRTSRRLGSFVRINSQAVQVEGGDLNGISVIRSNRRLGVAK